MRASITLNSGEALLDLPLVDRSWFAFLSEVQEGMSGANRQQRLNRYLASHNSSREAFLVRIGLTRPYPPKFGRCQVMLDTLLPMPRQSWVAEFLKALRTE